MEAAAAIAEIVSVFLTNIFNIIGVGVVVGLLYEKFVKK